MSIKSELLALQRAGRGGVLRAKDVLDWARANKTSALHRRIDWDTKSAAQKWQLHQIRNLIQIHVVTDVREPMLVSLSIDRTMAGGGYRAIDDVLTSKQLSDVMLMDALKDLEILQTKYRRVLQLTSIWKEVDRVRATHAPSRAAKKKAPGRKAA